MSKRKWKTCRPSSLRRCTTWCTSGWTRMRSGWTARQRAPLRSSKYRRVHSHLPTRHLPNTLCDNTLNIVTTSPKANSSLHLLTVKAHSHRTKAKFVFGVFVHSLICFACSFNTFTLAPTFVWCEQTLGWKWHVIILANEIIQTTTF